MRTAPAMPRWTGVAPLDGSTSMQFRMRSPAHRIASPITQTQREQIFAFSDSEAEADATSSSNSSSASNASAADDESDSVSGGDSDDDDDNDDEDETSASDSDSDFASETTSGYNSDGDDSISGINSMSSSSVSRVGGSPASRVWGLSHCHDNLGIVALMIPTMGLTTMAVTEYLACTTHFDCSTHYPTLSYAAQFKPEGHAFTLGMCTTALLIFCASLLFHWFLKLRLQAPAEEDGHSRRVLIWTHLGTGVVTAVSLSGLAVMDMGAHHDAHVAFTVVFFFTAWGTIVSVHVARRRLLREDEEAKLSQPTTTKKKRALSTSASAVTTTVTTALRSGCQWWKHMSILSMYRLGRVLVFSGMASTALFVLLFLCVNGTWPNPMGFTAMQEAFFEAFAIVCQLLFMGTLCCELAMLTRIVEHHEYEQLERSE